MKRWPVVVFPKAERDLAEARSWYDTQDVGLGERFLNAADETRDSLAHFPHRFRTFYRDLRRAGVVKFPYALFFRIEADVVAVVRVLHSAQDHHHRL